MGCKQQFGLVRLCLAISMQVLVAAESFLRWRPPPMYVFGDSILDVGNNNYLPGANVSRANMPYYGIDLFPGRIPTGRFSNGHNTVDYIARSMGWLHSPPPYLSLAPERLMTSLILTAGTLTTGVNYASAGAGILDSTNAGKSIPLSRQVEYFNATRATMLAAMDDGTVDDLLAKSIFLISAGSNDLLLSQQQQSRNSSSGRSSSLVVSVSDLISNYSATIEDLYDMGARKFAIINLGPLGCVPAVRVLNSTGGGCAAGLNQLASSFDAALRPMLTGLATRMPDMAYSLADYFGLAQDAFADPQASGYTDIAGACCGGGRLLAEAGCLPNSTVCTSRDERDSHVFWDRFNPSQRASLLTAQAFYDGPVKYTEPINFMQLAQSSS
ncbi:unnamed protein product [Urochloa decumbens]|uniref:GDSL esterase/lipase n=1 Tax=Urochloa decumbens TaxID=240449 RepID=A0ABC9DKD8_9POAL